jgi:triphosphatase
MEVELKLEVAPQDLVKVGRSKALDAVQHGAARASRLFSVYYDTPGQDLRRRGFSLRLRRQGRKWTQTLKGPGRVFGGLHSRDEYEWPLRRAALDAQALRETPHRALFKRKLRESLVPAFSTDFRRRSLELEFEDGSRAELALDRGEIRAGRRRTPLAEVEVELLAGDSAAMIEFASRLAEEVPFSIGMSSKAERGYGLLAPVAAAPRRNQPVELEPSLPASAAIARLAQSCLVHARANEEGFLARTDTEYLHQLRVGLRRLRAVLTVPREDEWRLALAPLRAELKWLWQALGAARNWDVFADEVLGRLSGHDRSEEIEELRRRASRLRRAEVERAREAVRSARYQRIWLSLARLFDAHGAALAPGRSARQLADAVLDRRYRKVLRWGDPPPSAPEALHRLRIEAKKLRYLAQLFAPVYGGKHAPRRAKRFLDALSDLQDVLGTINDASISVALIEQAALDGKQPLDREAAGLATGWVAAKREEARLALPEIWRAFAGARPFWS